MTAALFGATGAGATFDLRGGDRYGYISFTTGTGTGGGNGGIQCTFSNLGDEKLMGDRDLDVLALDVTTAGATMGGGPSNTSFGCTGFVLSVNGLADNTTYQWAYCVR